MKIIVLASQKGGTGKTTLAGHLAVQAGAGAAVLDFDPQQSLSDWWREREAEDLPALDLAPADLAGKRSALEDAGLRWLIIDTPPHGEGSGVVAAAVAAADFVVIPCRPSPHDLRAVRATVELAQRHGKPLAFVLNGAKPRTNLATQAVAELSAHGTVCPATVADRTLYASAMIDGRTAQEIEPAGLAAAEIRAAWRWIARQLDGAKQPEKNKIKV